MVDSPRCRIFWFHFLIFRHRDHAHRTEFLHLEDVQTKRIELEMLKGRQPTWFICKVIVRGQTIGVDLKMCEFTTDTENRLVVAKVGGGLGTKDSEVGVSRCKLRRTEWVHSTENYILCEMQGNIL